LTLHFRSTDKRSIHLLDPGFQDGLSARASRQDMFQTIQRMVPVLDTRELPSGGFLVRPAGVLKLEREDLKPGSEANPPMLEILPRDLSPRLNRS
jgi:hypothetical protein